MISFLEVIKKRNLPVRYKDYFFYKKINLECLTNNKVRARLQNQIAVIPITGKKKNNYSYQ